MTMATSLPIDLDRLDLDAIRVGALRDRPVTVLGLARSGIALDPKFSNANAQTSSEYHGVVVTYAQVASHPAIVPRAVRTASWWCCAPDRVASRPARSFR